MKTSTRSCLYELSGRWFFQHLTEWCIKPSLMRVSQVRLFCMTQSSRSKLWFLTKRCNTWMCWKTLLPAKTNQNIWRINISLLTGSNPHYSYLLWFQYNSWLASTSGNLEMLLYIPEGKLARHWSIQWIWEFVIILFWKLKVLSLSSVWMP